MNHIDIQSLLLGQDTGTETDEKDENKNTNHISVFKLPITYLDESKKFQLSDIIANDLELESKSNRNMYSYLLESDFSDSKNTKSYAEELLPEWRTNYTTDVDFLTDTQQIIREMDSVEEFKNSITDETMQSHWKKLKQDPHFLEKYGYLEWDVLAHFNQSSTFLQALTMIHIISPIMSFFIPILFFIFPFIILKIQGIPIEFSVYMDVLKNIARHHFIGKALMSFDSFTFESMMYLIGTFGLYALQMYQNTTQCIRFYRNTQYMNTSLCEWKEYVQEMIHKMKSFLRSYREIKTYRPFCKELQKHCSVLEQILEDLKPIQPFEMSIFKASEIGYMLKTFYLLHTNSEYEESLSYSMGFKGFLCHLREIAKRVRSGILGYATFLGPESECEKKLEELEEEFEEKCETEEFEEIERKEEQQIYQQYYPPHQCDTNCIKNDAILDQHIIITGPNASGKTTFLKTTAINLIFSQQFGVGFYKSCQIRPYTHFHSYLNIPDTSGRDSLFQAESRRCKEILDIITDYPQEKGFSHFCIFDELYSGTNPVEATKSAYAFLKYLSEMHTHIRFLLTTHYTSICEKWGENDCIQNYQMEVVEGESDHKNTYKIKKGISTIQGAIRILREMNYPVQILDYIQTYE